MADRRTDMEDVRARLAAAARVADPRDLPALSRELRAVWAELDRLPDARTDTPADEIAKRREDRRKKAAGA